MPYKDAAKRTEARLKIENQRENIEMFETSLAAMNATPSPQALLELFKQQLDIMETIMDGYPTWADSAGYLM